MSTKELHLHNELVTAQLLQDVLSSLSESSARAAVHDVVFKYDDTQFSKVFKAQILVAMEAYMDVPYESEDYVNTVAFETCKVLGFGIETLEFILSKLPFVGKSCYHGLKYGHVKAFKLHTNTIHKLKTLDMSEEKETEITIAPSAPQSNEDKLNTIKNETTTPPLAGE